MTKKNKNPKKYSILSEQRYLFFDEDTEGSPTPAPEDDDGSDYETGTPIPEKQESKETTAKTPERKETFTSIDAIIKDTEGLSSYKKLSTDFKLKSTIAQSQDIASLIESIADFGIDISTEIPNSLGTNSWDTTMNTLLNSYEKTTPSILEAIGNLTGTKFSNINKIKISFKNLPNREEMDSSPQMILEIPTKEKNIKIEIDAYETEEALSSSIELANSDAALSANGIKLKEIYPDEDNSKLRTVIEMGNKDQGLDISIDRNGIITGITLPQNSDADYVGKEELEVALKKFIGQNIYEVSGPKISDAINDAILKTCENKANQQSTTAPALAVGRNLPKKPRTTLPIKPKPQVEPKKAPDTPKSPPTPQQQPKPVEAQAAQTIAKAAPKPPNAPTTTPAQSPTPQTESAETQKETYNLFGEETEIVTTDNKGRPTLVNWEGDAFSISYSQDGKTSDVTLGGGINANKELVSPKKFFRVTDLEGGNIQVLKLDANGQAGDKVYEGPKSDIKLAQILTSLNNQNAGSQTVAASPPPTADQTNQPAADAPQAPNAPSATPSGQKYEITEGEPEEENEFAALIRTAGLYIGAIMEDITSYKIDRTATTKLNSRLSLSEPLSYEEKRTFALAKYGFDVDMTKEQLEVFQEKVKIDRFLGSNPSQFFDPQAKYQEFIADPSKVPIREFLVTKKLYDHFKGIRDEVKGADENGQIDTHPKNQALEELFLSIILTKNVGSKPQPLAQEGVTKYLERILRSDPYIGPDGKPLTGKALEDKKKSIEDKSGRQPFYPWMNFEDYEKHTQAKTQKETAERIASRSLDLSTLNPPATIEFTPNVARLLMTMKAEDFISFQNKSATEDLGSQGSLNFAAIKKLSTDFNNRIASNEIKLPKNLELLNVSQLFGRTEYIDKISKSTDPQHNQQERIFAPLPTASDTYFAKLREETPIDVLMQDIENMPPDTFKTLFALTPAQLLDFALDGKLSAADPAKGEPQVLEGKESKAPIPKSIARYLIIKYMESQNLAGQPLSKFEAARPDLTTVGEMFKVSDLRPTLRPFDEIAKQSYDPNDGARTTMQPYGQFFVQILQNMPSDTDYSHSSPAEITSMLKESGFHYLAASLDLNYDPMTQKNKPEEKPAEPTTPIAPPEAPTTSPPTETQDTQYDE